MQRRQTEKQMEMEKQQKQNHGPFPHLLQAQSALTSLQPLK